MGQELEAIEITVTTKDCHTMYTAICDAITTLAWVTCKTSTRTRRFTATKNILV